MSSIIFLCYYVSGEVYDWPELYVFIWSKMILLDLCYIEWIYLSLSASTSKMENLILHFLVACNDGLVRQQVEL